MYAVHPQGFSFYMQKKEPIDRSFVVVREKRGRTIPAQKVRPLDDWAFPTLESFPSTTAECEHYE
jgi:hypothetical protein